MNNKEVKIDIKCHWSSHDGWHFYYKDTQVWVIKEGFRVADIVDGIFDNHKTFVLLEEAINDMRYRYL